MCYLERDKSVKPRRRQAWPAVSCGGNFYAAPVRYALLITYEMLMKASLMVFPFVVCSSRFCKALVVSKALLSKGGHLLLQHQEG